MSSDRKPLKEYESKRNFRVTGEPASGAAAADGNAVFVVQKHLARNLHYDLRLEMEGVLKSWAIPKGPSLDPAVKRLAIHVEDHPLDYARFEGVIPEGEYGAGNMIVWDTGMWQVVDAKGTGYAEGNLKFDLHGEKLQGKWALVRIGEVEKRQWLLIKERDAYAKSEKEFVVTNQYPLSVLTGRDVHELTSPHRLAAGGVENNQVPRPAVRGSLQPVRLPSATQAALPAHLSPQLATTTKETPEGDEWLHEIKLDGYRLLAQKQESGVKLTTRNGHDWTSRFPSVASAVKSISANEFLLDGELVRLRSDGVSDFAALQSALRDGEENLLVYFVFDLLYLDGYQLLDVPLLERKKLLSDLLATVDNARIQFCDHIVGNGTAFFEQCRNAGLEGTISKRVSCRYRSGRSASWLKQKCLLLDDFIIVGYARSQNRRNMLRSLILAYYEHGELCYAGKVGTGLSEHMLYDVQRQCDQLVSSCGLATCPGELAAEDIVWCQPRMVARVHYLGWTRSNQLRHAAFIGLRADTAPEQVLEPDSIEAKTRMMSQAKKTASLEHVTGEQLQQLESFKLTNPNKILYPFIQGSKLDIAKYYVSVSQWMLPYIHDRPMSLVRFPDGIEQSSFFQKHPLEGMHPSIDLIEDAKNEKPLIGISSLLGLVSAVQLAAIEFHPWSARRDRLDRPDRVIFDFDPGPKICWSDVKEAAFECREILQAVGLQSFVKTSGGKGIHVIVPIRRRSSWDEAIQLAKAIAKSMEKAVPERYTSNLSKQARDSKILIDVHRNHRGATCVAAYSLRASNVATVSMPLSWSELSKTSDPREFDLSSVTRIVSKRKQDPWADLYMVKQSLTRPIMKRISS